MTRRAIRRLTTRALPVLALLTYATSAGAQACNDGVIFCTNYGYQCLVSTCDPTMPGNACCEYSCMKPGGGGAGSGPGENMT